MTESLGEVLIESGLSIERALNQPGVVLPDAAALAAILDVKTALLMLALHLDLPADDSLPGPLPRLLVPSSPADVSAPSPRVARQRLRRDSTPPGARRVARQRLKIARAPRGSSSPVLFLTASEVAALLKVHVSTVYGLIRAGRLRSVRVGARGVRVPSSAIGELHA